MAFQLLISPTAQIPFNNLTPLPDLTILVCCINVLKHIAINLKKNK